MATALSRDRRAARASEVQGLGRRQPDQAKTRRGILASVNTWLAKSHDKSSDNRNGGSIGQVEISNEPTGMSRRQQEHYIVLEHELLLLAEAHYTAPREQVFDLFAKELMRFDVRDVREGIAALRPEPQPDYRAAFPDLGTLIERTKLAYKQRTKPRAYVPCGNCREAWV